MDSPINPKQKLFAFEDCMQVDGSGSKVRNYFADKFFFSGEGKDENICNARCSPVDKNFLYETECDKPWKNWPCQMNANSAGFLECEDHVLSDFAWRSPHRLKRRDVEARDCFSILGSPSPYSVHGRSKNGHNFIASDVQRCPAVEKYGGLQDINDQPAWSYFVTEDTKDSLSMLSEESCSSSAVMGEATMESSPNLIERESIGIHVNYLRKPLHGYDLENLYAKETGYSNKNVNPKEQNVKGSGRQTRMSKAAHNPITFQEKAGKDDNRLFEEGYELVDMSSSLCSFGQTSEITSSGWTDDLIIPKLQINAELLVKSSKHGIPVECPPSGHLSSGKHAFNQPFCHVQPPDSPIFSGIGPELIMSDLLWGPELAGIPDSSPFAGAHRDKDFLDISVQERVGKDGESKSKIPPADCQNFELTDETVMSHNDASSENRKPIIDSYSNDICGKCKEAGDTTTTAEGTSSANVPDEFGKSVGGKEYINKEHSCDAKLSLPCPDGCKETKSAELGERTVVCTGQDNQNDPNQQVMMLESYVLQLLCVQKVLKETSARNATNALKKV